MKKLILIISALAALALPASASAWGGNSFAPVAPAAQGSSGSESGAVRPQARSLDPGLFADLASGITLVRNVNCAGKTIGQGTGFLVGTSVVMTARHVI